MMQIFAFSDFEIGKVYQFIDRGSVNIEYWEDRKNHPEPKTSYFMKCCITHNKMRFMKCDKDGKLIDHQNHFPLVNQIFDKQAIYQL